MNIEDLRNCCLAIKNAKECTPFKENIRIYEIMNKMFAFFSLQPKKAEYFVVVKCDPEKSVELREKKFFLHVGGNIGFIYTQGRKRFIPASWLLHG